MKYEKFINVMNKKVNTILLLSIVLFIWGLVAFRIWKWVKPEQPVSYPVQTETIDDKPLPAKLILNYRDPFLSAGYSNRKTETTAHSTRKHAAAPRPSLKYKGMLRGKDGIKRAIVEHQGEISTLAIGESLVGVEIIEIAPEEITVMWNKQREKIEVR